MGRAAFPARNQPLLARPGEVRPVNQPTATGELEFPPFEPPELVATRRAGAALVVVRALMLAWALVAAWRVDAAANDPVPRAPSGVLTAVGWFIVAGWFLAAARWSWLRTTNVHRLEGRYPTRTRAAVVWAYPAVWVLLMGVTLVPATPNPDFDYRPPIIVAGFVLTMVSGYRIVHRIFKSLVRMPPTATCVALYLVDVLAFGLLWWRVTSWSGRDGIATIDSDLDLGILVAASVALAAATVLLWYLDRAANRGEEIRMLALRTRYDHRMARLNGLDPMNPGTRYALMLARRAAERAAQRPVDDRTVDAFAPDDPLLVELAKELESGITPEFAELVRELERRTDGMQPSRAPSESQEDTEPGAPKASRLWLAELLRYLVVGVYAGCAAAAVVLVVEFRRGDTDSVEVIRRTLHWGAAGVHILVALWATRIAVDARRFGLPALWRLPVAAFVSSVVVVPLWFSADVGSDAAKLGLFTVLTLGLELALWRITAIDWLVVYRESDSPLEAWMSIAPFVLGLLLLSPMRDELPLDVSSGRVAFFATLIGLASALSGGLAAVAMVQLEDALRATTPGDRAGERPEAGGAGQPAVVDLPAAPVERSAGTSRTPTAKPRSATVEPLRVDLTDISPELAAGLGIGVDAPPDTERAPAAATEPDAKEPPAKKSPAKKQPAKKAASTKQPPATKQPAATRKPAAKRSAATPPPAGTPPEPGAPPETPEAVTKPAAKSAAKKAPAAKKTAATKTAATKAPAKKAPAKKAAAEKPAAAAPSDGDPLALEADADDGRAHEDAADPIHQVEGSADGIGRLGEHVDDADQREQDHDVPEPGDDADESAGPGRR